MRKRLLKLNKKSGKIVDFIFTVAFIILLGFVAYFIYLAVLMG